MLQPRVFAATGLLSLMLAACAPEATETAAAPAVVDDQHPGKAVYEQWCASCHDDGERTGAPSLAAIRTLNRATVRYALELGYMSQQSKDVPKADLEQVIQWLPQADHANDDWVKEAQCPIKLRKVRLDGAARTAVDFGLGHHNNRAQSKDNAGLSKEDMRDLEVAWVAAFPQTPTMRSQPVIVGDTIFIAATDAGRLYALDTNTGCAKWVYASDMTLRSSLAFADATDKNPALILMGDAAGKVHAVNAISGAKAWVTDVKLNHLNRITGAPMVHDGVVFTPVSVIESNFPPNDKYECCKGQGALAALDLATGKKLWVARTIDQEIGPTRISRTGTQQYGPAGAMVWASPILDTKRNQVIIGTGESLSWPATDTSDAQIAYDMKTGQRKWVFQATRNDIWNSACGRRGANCDWPGEYWSPDFDFGATSMLVKRNDGTEMVVAGQKSGVVWALNPDNGQMLWSNRIGRGSAQGGVHWGMAYEDNRIFVPLNDAATPAENPNWGPGIHALDAVTGEVQWSYKPNQRDCGENRPVAKATQPPPEWRIVPTAAPMPPVPRPPPVARPAAARPATVAARTPATPPAATPAAAPAAAPAAIAVSGEGGGPARARPRCRLGMSPAPILVDGALVTGTLQGWLRIFDGKTGDVLFEYNTNREYDDTTTGVPGHGGSLDSAPYVAGDGKLFVQSGYARFGENPGNVLIAFRPKKK